MINSKYLEIQKVQVRGDKRRQQEIYAGVGEWGKMYVPIQGIPQMYQYVKAGYNKQEQKIANEK